MSKVSELIKELCPTGVKSYEIKEVSSVTIGEFVHKNKQSDDGKYPVYNGGTSNTGFYDEYNNDGHKVIISARGANAGFINRVKGKYWAGNSCYTININDESQLDWNYLYQYLKNNQSTLLGVQQTGSIPAISKKQVEEFKIAIPPLAVQQEIVRILDKFGELEVELEVELEARKSQYEFWHGQLFNKAGNTKIADVFRRLKGTSITAGTMKEIEDPEGDIRIFAGGQTAVNARVESINKPNIIDVPCVIVQSRGLIDFIYYDKPCTFKNEMWAYTCDNQITVKYLYYYLKNNVQYFRTIGSQMGSMPQISLPVTEKYNIYLPSLDEQKRIVNILDKFDTLVNDITSGIPAEIELRRQQYEYYRNKLLNFEELKVN